MTFGNPTGMLEHQTRTILAKSGIKFDIPNRHITDFDIILVWAPTEITSQWVALKYPSKVMHDLMHLRNDLYCVEWGVKLYSLTHSGTHNNMHNSEKMMKTCNFI